MQHKEECLLYTPRKWFYKTWIVYFEQVKLMPVLILKTNLVGLLVVIMNACELHYTVINQYLDGKHPFLWCFQVNWVGLGINNVSF